MSKDKEPMSIKDKLLMIQRKVAGTIAFDSTNPHFKNKYASLEQVLNKLMPAVNEAGIVLTQKIALVEGFWCVRTVVMDSVALEELSCMPIINPKGDAQGFGSALSYAKRYSLLSAFCMVGGEEDDDGEGAQGRDTRREPINKLAAIVRYDGSPEAKVKLAELFKKFQATTDQMKAIAPTLIGKTWSECEVAIDGHITSAKLTKGVFES